MAQAAARVAASGRDADEAQKLLKEQELKLQQAKDIVTAVDAAIKTGSAHQVMHIFSIKYGSHSLVTLHTRRISLPNLRLQLILPEHLLQPF
eukprot:233904-Prorocentrum_minimum.AAC.2